MEKHDETTSIEYEDPYVWRDVIKLMYDNITLVIDSTEIPTHKPVLAQHSRYFK